MPDSSYSCSYQSDKERTSGRVLPNMQIIKMSGNFAPENSCYRQFPARQALRGGVKYSFSQGHMVNSIQRKTVPKDNPYAVAIGLMIRCCIIHSLKVVQPFLYLDVSSLDRG